MVRTAPSGSKDFTKATSAVVGRIKQHATCFWLFANSLATITASLPAIELDHLPSVAAPYSGILQTSHRVTTEEVPMHSTM